MINISRPQRQFASDNYAGICPEAWQSLAEANRGHAPAYGDDEWTTRASDLIREVFETDCEVFFTFNGTAANSLALASLCQSYHSIICSEVAHIETDECGAPEFFSNGTKILVSSASDGKLTVAGLRHLVERRSDIHYPKPQVMSLTLPTELGTLYSIDELALLCETARSLKLRVHLDGARFGNAVAALGVAPKDVTWRAGVDVLCFGGTKMGLPASEAVVFFSRALADDFAYRCKQAGQLASKMRFLSAPWVGMLRSGAWLAHAAHANRMAQLLAEKFRALGVELLQPSQVNSVFVRLDPAVAARLRERGWQFYNFIGHGGARFMCCWDTQEADVLGLALDVAECVG